MKRILILVIGICLSLGSAISQVKVDKGHNSQKTQLDEDVFTKHQGSILAVKYGLKAGANFSSLSNDMKFDPKFSTGVGYHVGGIINLHWGQRTANSLPGTGLWGVQSEVLYSHSVIKGETDDLELNEIKVPLMLKYYPLSTFSIELGPEFSYLMSCSPDMYVAENAEIYVKDCKGFGMGVGAGISYEHPKGFCLSARYIYKFTDLAENLKWKNNMNILISMGWMF